MLLLRLHPVNRPTDTKCGQFSACIGFLPSVILFFYRTRSIYRSENLVSPPGTDFAITQAGLSKKEDKEMKKSLKALICTVAFLSLLVAADCFAETAVTANGKRVILNDNGTWEWAKVTAAAETEKDFRNVRWGMSIEEVKKAETSKMVDESDTILIYESSLAGLDVYVGYVFTSGILVRGKYISVEKHSNRNDYINDYNSLKDLLTKKYGETTENHVYWLNDLYRDDYSEWGFAVSLGHLKYFDSWETGRTDITAALTGENYDISLGIEYGSKELGDLEVQQREESSLGDL